MNYLKKHIRRGPIVTELDGDRVGRDPAESRPELLHLYCPAAHWVSDKKRCYLDDGSMLGLRL